MRVRVVEQTQFAFGSALWGLPLLVVPVLPGSVVHADRIRCVRFDGRLPEAGPAFYVTTPAYVEQPGGEVSIYHVTGGDSLVEDVLHGEAALAAWEVWQYGVGVSDVDP